jgi:anti-sigma regulatory factor (Ser/Thr protein kinase)
MTAGSSGPAVDVPLVWSRVFPAISAQAREARLFLSGMLADFPAADDAVLCLSELVANATIHSHSRQPCGYFTVRAEMCDGSRLRVEVTDQGGSWVDHQTADDEPGGRGLLIVARLARDWGRSGDSQAGWTVWFEIDCRHRV